MLVGFYLITFFCVNVFAGPTDSPPAGHYDVIVIGCGVSGLAATAELGRNGKRVLCLEAADRIGGRVRTVPFGDGIVEMGAEWIHGTIGSLTYDLAMAHNITVISQGDKQKLYRSHEGLLNSTIQDVLNKVTEVALDCLDKVDEKATPMGDKIVMRIHGTIGSLTYDLAMAHNITVISQGDKQKLYRSHEGLLNSTIQDVLNKVTEVALDCLDKVDEKATPMGDKIVMSCNEYLEKNHPDIFKDKQLIDEFYASLNLGISSYEAASDWNELSSSSFYEDLGGDLHMSWHELGYKTLFEIILNKHNGGEGIPSTEILLNTEVTKITWGNDLVIVTTRNHTTYVTPSVIVTLSLGVLKERHAKLFFPLLPKDKIDAINNISMGVLSKIIVSFDKKWWPTSQKTMDLFLWKNEDAEKLSKDDEWILKIASASRSMGSNNTMTFWTSGEMGKQIEMMSDEVLKAGITKILQTFYGEDVPEPKELIKSNWHSNPYTRGSYSFDGSTMSPTSRSTLSVPLHDSNGQNRLLFAGEATNVPHYSTVHGAYETGLREANRILGKGEV